MYTIKAAAELTGVPEATLRAWERRYGVFTPERTASGYRLYDEGALARIRTMKALLESGWAPRQAAARLRDAEGSPPATTPAFIALIDPFLDAATALDAERVDAILTQAFASAEFATVVDQWLLPTLLEMGVRWHDGRLSIASEHLASHALQRRLYTIFQAAPASPHGPRVVLGLAPGSRHELGILAFAVAAQRSGMNVLYLGADLPTDQWVAAVHQHDADAVVLSAPLPTDVYGVNDVIGALHDRYPGIWIGVGGTYQDQVDDTARRLGHSIAYGVRALTEACSSRRTEVKTS